MQTRTQARLAAILKKAREASCRSQEHLAEEAGLSVPTVRRAEVLGKVSPESLRAYCSVVELDAVEVMARASRSEEAEHYERVEIPDRPLVIRTRTLPHSAAWLRGGWGSALNVASCLAPGVWFGIWTVMEVLWAFRDLASGEALGSMAFSLALVVCVVCAIGYSWMSFKVMRSLEEMLAPLVWDRIWRLAVVFPLPVGLMAFATSPNPLTTSALLATGITVSFLALGLLYQHLRIKARVNQRTSSLEAFTRRGPEVLSMVRSIISQPVGVADAARLRSLVVEYAHLAAGAEQGDCAKPLVMLDEDIARGVSGRKALMDYVSLAEKAARADTSHIRYRADLARAVDYLEMRLSPLA